MIYRTLPSSSHPLFELRSIAAEDLQHWYAYLSQPLAYEHTSWNLASVDDLAHYAECLAAPTPDSMLRLAIAERSSGKLVGTVGFHSVFWPDRRAELAYDLSPQIWGRGIATLMAGLMVEWAHAEAGINRVQATVLDSNARSKAVLERCGFRHEGLLHQYRMVRGSPRSFCMYSHLPSS